MTSGRCVFSGSGLDNVQSSSFSLLGYLTSNLKVELSTLSDNQRYFLACEFSTDIDSRRSVHPVGHTSNELR